MKWRNSHIDVDVLISDKTLRLLKKSLEESSKESYFFQYVYTSILEKTIEDLIKEDSTIQSYFMDYLSNKAHGIIFYKSLDPRKEKITLDEFFFFCSSTLHKKPRFIVRVIDDMGKYSKPMFLDKLFF